MLLTPLSLDTDGGAGPRDRLSPHMPDWIEEQGRQWKSPAGSGALVWRHSIAFVLATHPDEGNDKFTFILVMLRDINLIPRRAASKFAYYRKVIISNSFFVIIVHVYCIMSSRVFFSFSIGIQMCKVGINDFAIRYSIAIMI